MHAQGGGNVKCRDAPEDMFKRQPCHCKAACCRADERPSLGSAIACTEYAALLVIVSPVYDGSRPSRSLSSASSSHAISTLPLLVACSGMCCPTQLCGWSAEGPATWSR